MAQDLRTSYLQSRKHFPCILETMEVELKVHTPEHFNAGVKDLLPYMSCLDAILAYCEMNNLEFDTVKRLIGTDLKRQLRKEAEDLHFIAKSARLPI